MTASIPRDGYTPINPNARIWPAMQGQDQWHPPLTPPPNLKLVGLDQYRAPLTPPQECFLPDSAFSA